MAGLTDIPGILVGHVSDYEGITGCTAILCPGGAVAGHEVRGSATGTEELEVLTPMHVVDKIHGVVLAGGSAFGLEAASGVRRYLEKRGVGYQTGAAKVPLVAGAILYDLAIGDPAARPTREMGRKAAAAAGSGPVPEGAVGAGTGATVGKFFGMERAMKSGIGCSTVELEGEFSGLRVAALAAVNAFGDVRDPGDGKILAGARTGAQALEFAGTAAWMKKASPGSRIGENTTLVVVATNARLTKVQAQKLAELAGAGMARAIDPVWTTVDGDLVIALSRGERRVPVNSLGVAAAEAVATAITRAVRLAPTLGGVPGLVR